MSRVVAWNPELNFNGLGRAKAKTNGFACEVVLGGGARFISHRVDEIRVDQRPRPGITNGVLTRGGFIMHRAAFLCIAQRLLAETRIQASLYAL